MAELETTVNDGIENGETEVTEVENGSDNAELARLKVEFAKQKAALDKATKEAAEAKKSLRAKQSAEEIAAEEKRIADEERDRKLAEYEKRFTVAETSKQIMGLGFVADEAIATTAAEYLYGAEDVSSALTAIQKAWTAKEKALRLEYGKIPSPGVGGSDGPSLTKDQLNAMNYMQRIEFANKHPDEYEALMGRK